MVQVVSLNKPKCSCTSCEKRFLRRTLLSAPTPADADSSSRNVESRPLADQRASNAHAGQKLTLFLNKAHCVRVVFLDPALWYLLTLSCTDSFSLTLWNEVSRNLPIVSWTRELPAKELIANRFWKVKVLGMEETIEGVDESDIEGPNPESLVTFNQN